MTRVNGYILRRYTMLQLGLTNLLYPPSNHLLSNLQEHIGISWNIPYTLRFVAGTANYKSWIFQPAMFN